MVAINSLVVLSHSDGMHGPLRLLCQSGPEVDTEAPGRLLGRFVELLEVMAG